MPSRLHLIASLMMGVHPMQVQLTHKQIVAIVAVRISKAQAKVTLRLAATHVALRSCWKKTLVHPLKVQSIK